jgi:aerobic-type carbon monoxide dehydrogenase small subunit (CoxS/CutS family)
MRAMLNDRDVEIPTDMAEEPLLFLLRDHFQLNGPKFGCGVGACGACTVLVDGEAQRSCMLTGADVAGSAVVTLDGLGRAGQPHALQTAWIEESVPQCGYCQNGQIMTAAGLLHGRPDAAPADIAVVMDTVVCRCGTQVRIRRAVLKAQRIMARS